VKRLSPRVNVIPVINEADSLTPAGLAESKKLVMEEIEHYRIPVYNFPYDIIDVGSVRYEQYWCGPDKRLELGFTCQCQDTGCQRYTYA
jgi:septin family protein